MFLLQEISSLSQTISADPRFGKLAGQQVLHISCIFVNDILYKQVKYICKSSKLILLK